MQAKVNTIKESLGCWAIKATEADGTSRLLSIRGDMPSLFWEKAEAKQAIASIVASNTRGKCKPVRVIVRYEEEDLCQK